MRILFYVAHLKNTPSLTRWRRPATILKACGNYWHCTRRRNLRRRWRMWPCAPNLTSAIYRDCGTIGCCCARHWRDARM